MRNLQTKEARTALLTSIIERMTGQGYKLEVYKGLQFLTKEQDGKFYLQAYKDNSTNAILNFYYRQESQMLARIEQTKQGYDIRKEYKAKAKAEQSGRLTGAAACADAVRAELKKVFPNTKFSVKSSTFSGGDAVRISWEDGATVAEVDNITNKYQYGSFNGMEDIYEYTNRVEGLPQAKYITTSRSMSDEIEAILKPIAVRLWAQFDGDAFNCRDVDQFLYRIFVHCSLPKNPTGLDIVKTGETCGVSSPEVFYKISFDAVNTTEAVEVAPLPTETGKINIIEYGKGLAVVGDTKPIKDQLKAMGGRFNFRLTCGAGWVFPMSKIEELKTLLSGLTKTQAENIDIPTVVKSEDVEQARNINDARAELKGEVLKTINFFAETDIKLYGEITEATKQAAKVQEVEIYQNIEDITEAANGGKIISLFNLSEIVNKPKTQQADTLPTVEQMKANILQLGF